jgi:hypothetical protein
MCVLLCAHPKIRDWIDLPLARAHRGSLQASNLCVTGWLDWDAEPRNCAIAAADLGQDKIPDFISKRSAWIQAYCQRLAARQRSLAAQGPGHHPLEAIANAWVRLLLVFVGWRR